MRRSGDRVPLKARDRGRPTALHQIERSAIFAVIFLINIDVLPL